MGKKVDDKKIGGVKLTRETTAVLGTEAVSEVSGVKATSGVVSVRGAGAIGQRRPTRTMSLEEREALFKLIEEEAESLFGHSAISNSQRQVVKTAVIMAVDSGLIAAQETLDPSPLKKPEK